MLEGPRVRFLSREIPRSNKAGGSIFWCNSHFSVNKLTVGNEQRSLYLTQPLSDWSILWLRRENLLAYNSICTARPHLSLGEGASLCRERIKFGVTALFAWIQLDWQINPAAFPTQ